MAELFDTPEAPLVRTYFENEGAWEHLKEAVQRSSPEGFRANVRLLESREYEGRKAQELIAAQTAPRGPGLAIFADKRALTEPGQPLLCVDLDSGQELRVIASLLWAVENNISVGNMDFDEFFDVTDADGVLRVAW